jgi:hypothetical protein
MRRRRHDGTGLGTEDEAQGNPKRMEFTGQAMAAPERQQWPLFHQPSVNGIDLGGPGRGRRSRALRRSRERLGAGKARFMTVSRHDFGVTGDTASKKSSRQFDDVTRLKHHCRNLRS